MKKLLNQRWETLAAIGCSPAIKSSKFWIFFVPISAKLLGSIPESVSIHGLSQEIPIHLSLPFSWQVLFFASVFYTVGNAIVLFICPPIIKDYASLKEFKEEGRSPLQAINMLRESAKEMGVNADESRWVADINQRHGAPMDIPMHPNDIKSPNMTDANHGDVFFACRKYVSFGRRNWRLWCTISYYIGFILTGIVAIQGFTFVVKASLKAL